MRRFILLVAAFVSLGLTGQAFGQTKTYTVNGKEVRLEVDPDHILVVPRGKVSRLAMVTQGIQAQARALRIDAPSQAEINRINKTGVTSVAKLAGYLVPRIGPNLKNDQVHSLARFGESLQ